MKFQVGDKLKWKLSGDVLEIIDIILGEHKYRYIIGGGKGYTYTDNLDRFQDKLRYLTKLELVLC